MSSTVIAPGLRQQIAEEAKHCCEYCQTQAIVIGMPLEVDHVVPESMGGATNHGNLCLACPRCNRYKGRQTDRLDEDTGEIALLFNPRQQQWQEHFAWQEGGLYLIGLTPVGRATVTALQMNNPFIVRSRQVWVKAGWHPPSES